MQEETFTLVNFATHLAALLRGRGITQKKLAHDVGVSEATVVKWLNGAIPRGEKLNRCAEYFGLHPDYLLNPERYENGIRKAAEEARRLPGSQQEKTALFNQRVMESALIQQSRQTGWDDAMKINEEMPAHAKSNPWRQRALAAERKLADLKALLKSTAETITLPES